MYVFIVVRLHIQMEFTGLSAAFTGLSASRAAAAAAGWPVSSIHIHSHSLAYQQNSHPHASLLTSHQTIVGRM